MKYDAEELPLGSVERAQAQFEQLDLRKALRTCRNAGIPLADVQSHALRCIDRLYAQKSYGVILSGYYEAGVIGPYKVDELLRKMLDLKDYPSFLKQAYRFDAYQAFVADIQTAIDWHIARKLPDAEAWRRKFAKLREQEELRVRASVDAPSVDVLDEDDVDASRPPTVFRLLPIKSIKLPRTSIDFTLPDDPYIVSQSSRAKIEKANSLHSKTLAVLQAFLVSKHVEVSESKLIDAFAVMRSRPAIFEIKSITEENEREQIRRAVGQLYEYRFLYALFTASLWVVFSQEPSSQWYIDYLKRDRDINVLWMQGDELQGPSFKELQTLTYRS